LKPDEMAVLINLRESSEDSGNSLVKSRKPKETGVVGVPRSDSVSRGGSLLLKLGIFEKGWAIAT